MDPLKELAREVVKRHLPELEVGNLPVEMETREYLTKGGKLVGLYWNCVALVETENGLVIKAHKVEYVR